MEQKNLVVFIPLPGAIFQCQLRDVPVSNLGLGSLVGNRAKKIRRRAKRAERVLERGLRQTPLPLPSPLPARLALLADFFCPIPGAWSQATRRAEIDGRGRHFE